MLIALIAAIAVIAPAASRDEPAPASRSLNRTLATAMTRPSEALPHGVPASYDWATHPRRGDATRARGFQAFTAWGQLYRCAQSTRTPRRAVELRDLQSWAFRRSTQRWRRLQHSSELRGASYPEDFQGASTAPVLLRRDPARTTVRLRPGFNFHFWPGGPRAPLAADDTEAVVVLLRARMQPVPGADGRPPCLVLSAGGDFWRAVSPAGGGRPVDAGIGRFLRVRRGWRTFAMSTASRALLREHPLPAVIR